MRFFLLCSAIRLHYADMMLDLFRNHRRNCTRFFCGLTTVFLLFIMYVIIHFFACGLLWQLVPFRECITRFSGILYPIIRPRQFLQKSASDFKNFRFDFPNENLHLWGYQKNLGYFFDWFSKMKKWFFRQNLKVGGYRKVSRWKSF